VVLMRGAGIPSVSIIGYNRHIDWEALVARIREADRGPARRRHRNEEYSLAHRGSPPRRLRQPARPLP
jgi:hypothetical protein